MTKLPWGTPLIFWAVPCLKIGFLKRLFLRLGRLFRAVNAAYALRAAEPMTKAPPAWLAAAKARVEAQEKQDQDRKAARAKKRAAERAKKEAPVARAPARTKEDFAARLDAALQKPARRETDATPKLRA